MKCDGTGAAQASLAGACCFFLEYLDQKQTQVKPLKAEQKQVLRVSFVGLSLNLLTVLLGHSLTPDTFTLKMKTYKPWNDRSQLCWCLFLLGNMMNGFI